MTNVLIVSNVSKKFNKKAILNDISFSIPAGQIVALLGENGAGKTTLINILLGLIQKIVERLVLLVKKLHK